MQKTQKMGPTAIHKKII